MEFLQLRVELCPISKGIIGASFGSATYTSKIFYMLNFAFMQPSRHFRLIWKTKCVMKIKVFIWLLFSDRLNTRDMLDRRKCAPLNADLICFLCSLQQRETFVYLFFSMPF
jgi:hypothetical protein